MSGKGNGSGVRGNHAASRVVISGTGRAGTTFLVRPSAALGRLVATCTTHGVPLTLIPYRVLIRDPRALRRLLSDVVRGIPEAVFSSVHYEVSTAPVS